jgi:hypothetical protein
MKRQWMKLFLAACSVGTYGSALHAQTYEMTAKVPFAFHVDKTDFPAGEYSINRTGSSSTQFLQNRTGPKIAIPGTANSDNKGNARLVFHRYGRDLFLAEIWNPVGTGSKVPMGKRERDVRERQGSNEVATISVAFTQAP